MASKRTAARNQKTDRVEFSSAAKQRPRNEHKIDAKFRLFDGGSLEESPDWRTKDGVFEISALTSSTKRALSEWEKGA